MKNQIFTTARLLWLTVLLSALAHSDVIDGPTEYLEHVSNPLASVWRSKLAPFSLSNNKLNAVVKCEPVYSRRLHGYPRTTGMMTGLCDTVTIAMQFMNRSGTPFALKDLSPGDWFAPRLFTTTSDITADVPVVDSVDLGYAQRGWLGLSGLVAMPDSLTADVPDIQLLYDVWDIPDGLWVLTLGTTNKTPNNLHLVYDGCVIERRSPMDGQDTVNAWLSLADREAAQLRFAESLPHIEKAIDYNPNSVPAWWMLGLHYMHVGDSAQTMDALGTAIQLCVEKSDPMLPDTSGTVSPFERDYMRALLYYLELDKKALSGPEFW